MALNNSINKSMNIIYPDGKHAIKAQYVQLTKDGKYILNYLESKRGIEEPSFTEIDKIGDEWVKNPFHSNYEEYEFEDFDAELSSRIVQELPENLKIRIRINDDRKDLTHLKENSNIEVSTNGAKEIVDKSVKDIYLIVMANEGDDSINPENGFIYDFPFPSFEIEGKAKHNDESYSDDVNEGLSFEELVFSRCGLAFDSRNKINNCLSSFSGITKIADIPNLDVNGELANETYRVHFIQCPDINVFNEIYKAGSINIDCEMNGDLTINQLITKALRNEIPMYYETEMGSKYNNRVKHIAVTK